MNSVIEMKTELQKLIDDAQTIASTTCQDAVAIAAQTGRLDFVSGLLAMIAIIIALGGIYSFFEVRRRASRVAKRTAEKEIGDIAERLVLQYLNDRVPNQVRMHVETLMPTNGDGESYGHEETADQS